MRAVFVALILNFQSVISAERTSTYFDLKELELTKFASQTFWKYILVLNWIHKLENLSVTRNSFFLLALNTNPPRQEADRRSKSKHSVILLKSMLFWPESRSDECHFLSLELSTLRYALMNSIVPYTNQVLPLLEQLTPWTRNRVKLLQSPYFFRPITPTHRHFVLSPVSLTSRDQDGCPSRKNRGLWTVYWPPYWQNKEVHQHGGSILGSIILCGKFRRISQLWDNAHTFNSKNCLLYL